MVLEIICKNCGNKQEYKLRNNKIPNRPKTQCKECQKWIYINRSLLTKNDDQKYDQINGKHDNIVSKGKSTDIHSLLTKNDDQINDQINDQIVPEDIKIVWNDLRPSIGSVFRKRKWPSKYASFQIFNNWMQSLLELEKRG